MGGDEREGLGEVKGEKTGQDIIYKRRIKKYKKNQGRSFCVSCLHPSYLLHL